MNVNKSIVTLVFSLFICGVISLVFFYEHRVQPMQRLYSAWIAYWAQNGRQSVYDHPEKFNEISPFSYEVDEDGALLDKLGFGNQSWRDFIVFCKTQKIKIIPTINWRNTQAMHTVLRDPLARQEHIKNIIDVVMFYDVEGIDINYEKKTVLMRDYFSKFMYELSLELKHYKKVLYCSIEPSSVIQPPLSIVCLCTLLGLQPSGWSNDVAILNQVCDTVRVMAYDYWFDDLVVIPHWWMNGIVCNAIRCIDPDKLVIGLSTHGWEFSVQANDTAKGSRIRSVSYGDACRVAKQNGSVITRTTEGELAFTYTSSQDNEKRQVCFSDAQVLRDKIQRVLASGVTGICFFKLSGKEEASLWE